MSLSHLVRSRDARDLGHQLRLLTSSRSITSTISARRRISSSQGKIRIIDDQHPRDRQIVETRGVAFKLRLDKFGISGTEPKGRGYLARELNAALAFVLCSPDIGAGRLAVDEPLANRVRSGRKQP